jgi:hypothetical protein
MFHPSWSHLQGVHLTLVHSKVNKLYVPDVKFWKSEHVTEVKIAKKM